jgi:hypothetical protein
MNLNRQTWRRLIAEIALAVLFSATVSLVAGQEKSTTGANVTSSSALHVTRDYRFEVASIKPADPSGRTTGPPQRSSPGHFCCIVVDIYGHLGNVKTQHRPEFNEFCRSPRGCPGTLLLNKAFKLRKIDASSNGT